MYVEEKTCVCMQVCVFPCVQISENSRISLNTSTQFQLLIYTCTSEMVLTKSWQKLRSETYRYMISLTQTQSNNNILAVVLFYIIDVKGLSVLWHFVLHKELSQNQHQHQKEKKEYATENIKLRDSSAV